MDDSTPLLIWAVTLSALIVAAVMAVLLGALLWNQRRLADEARRWGRHVLERLDAERNRIAAELHDDIVPQLSAVRRRAADAGREGDAEVLEEVTTGLRGLAHDLHPPALRHLDLGTALSDLTEEWWEASGPELVLEVAEELPPLDESHSLALYRIAQEAVMNALKHAAAKVITIRLARSGRELLMQVEDNGRGVADPAALAHGFGARSMRERAATLHGTLTVEPAPAGGTIVSCRVPIP